MTNSDNSNSKLPTGKALDKNNQPFYKDETVTIQKIAEQDWLRINWKGYQTEASIKNGCEKLLDAVNHFKVSKVLYDNSLVVGIWTPAANWVGTNWLPRMQQAGLQQLAWVYSPSRLSQVSTNQALACTTVPHLVKTFYKEEEAREWLQHNPAQ